MIIQLGIYELILIMQKLQPFNYIKLHLPGETHFPPKYEELSLLPVEFNCLEFYLQENADPHLHISQQFFLLINL